MPQPPPSSRRVSLHTRAAQVQVFACEDRLSDIDAHVTDIHMRDAIRASGIRQPGFPVHHLLQRPAGQNHKLFRLDHYRRTRDDSRTVARHHPATLAVGAGVTESSVNQFVFFN